MIISHRGNISGPDPNTENNPKQIDNVINMGFMAEIDIWEIDNKFWLGHDNPTYHISEKWILNHIDKVIYHLKNKQIIKAFQKDQFNHAHWFINEHDIATLTSCNYLWCHYLNPIITPRAILLNFTNDKSDLAELKDMYVNGDIAGICLDYIKDYCNDSNWNA